MCPLIPHPNESGHLWNQFPARSIQSWLTDWKIFRSECNFENSFFSDATTKRTIIQTAPPRWTWSPTPCSTLQMTRKRPRKQTPIHPRQIQSIDDRDCGSFEASRNASDPGAHCEKSCRSYTGLYFLNICQSEAKLFLNFCNPENSLYGLSRCHNGEFWRKLTMMSTELKFINLKFIPKSFVRVFPKFVFLTKKGWYEIPTKGVWNRRNWLRRLTYDSNCYDLTISSTFIASRR